MNFFLHKGAIKAGPSGAMLLRKGWGQWELPEKCSYIRDIDASKSRDCPGCRDATGGWTLHAQ